MKRIIKSISLSGLLLSIGFSFALAQQAPELVDQAGYYNMWVGNIKVIALNDGTLGMPADELLIGIEPKKVENMLRENFLSLPLENSINAFLIQRNDKLILVDAGTAGFFGPTLGKVSASIQHAGYSPADIDAVLITHLHPDHSGGLLINGKRAFPNATVYLHQDELDFWMDESLTEKAEGNMKYFFTTAQQSMKPYLQAGQVKTFTGEQEVLPGVMAIPAAGHTPGHTFYSLQSHGEQMLFVGDIIHVPAVQLVKPEVTIQYDVDTKTAASIRKQAMDAAAKGGYWLAIDHMPFPGIGHLKSAGAGYQWFPVNYSTYK